MTTLLRILISLLLTLWLGGVMFFAVVAAIAFRVLPDKYSAGLVVRNALLALHTEGLVAGSLLLLLLLLAGWTQAYGRAVTGPLLCIVAMLGLTGFSQWGVMPRMEKDRLAAGGEIARAPTGDPPRGEVARRHRARGWLEEGVLLAGVAAVGLLALPAGSQRPRLPEQAGFSSSPTSRR